MSAETSPRPFVSKPSLLRRPITSCHKFQGATKIDIPTPHGNSGSSAEGSLDLIDLPPLLSPKSYIRLIENS